MRLKTMASILLVAMCAVSGCTASQAGKEEGTSVARVGAGKAGGTSLERAGTPLTLTVERIGTGAAVELLAIVSVVGRTPAPVVLKATPGEGTLLEAGAEMEELGQLEPGSTVERKFRISGPAPTLEIRAISQAKAAAATAVAIWPAEARSELERPNTTPIPPVKVGGVVIREAVPLYPDGAPEGGETGRGQ